MKLSDCLNIDDLRAMARKRAHRMVFDYIDGGADDEVTLRANTTAFDRVALPHRVLAGVADVDASVTFMGRRHPLPFFCGPAAGNRMFHTQGERAVARAAARHGLVYCLSTLSSVSIEEIAALTDGPKWFQVYVWRGKGLLREMLQRARTSGYEARFIRASRGANLPLI